MGKGSKRSNLVANETLCQLSYDPIQLSCRHLQLKPPASSFSPLTGIYYAIFRDEGKLR